MVNILVGIGMAIFGIYTIATFNGDMTLAWNIKYWGLTLGGCGIVMYNVIPYLFTLANNIKLPQPIQTKVEKETKVRELSKDIKMENEQEIDNSCLFYLTERLKGNPDARELLRKLSDALFNLHHPDVK